MKSVLHIITMIFTSISTLIYGQIQNYGSFRMHTESKMAFYGDFVNVGSFNNNLGALYVLGSEPQEFSGTSIVQANNFIINKNSQPLHLNNVLSVDSVLTFTNGRITTDRSDISTEYLVFQDGANYILASDSSHVDGVVRKIGDDDFVFPVGDADLLRTISISAPSNISDHFTAYYTESNPDALYDRSLLESGIDHVSACEYWILNRTSGTSNVEVSMSWESNSCGVDNLCDLIISRWDGAQWTSEGNGGTSGTVSEGSLVSGSGCTTPASINDFSPFTLASVSSSNPLPISLLLFKAEVCERSVCLNWITESETNNDYFTVERSKDGMNWKAIDSINGAGNSNSTLTYESIDKKPYPGLSYYRLKQTDFNGAYKYTDVSAINLSASSSEELTIYPNPAKNIITINGLSTEEEGLKYYNSIGKEVTGLINTLNKGDSSIELEVSQLNKGVYYVRSENMYGSFIKH